MTQEERRVYLIKKLISEHPRYADIQIPTDADEQKRLLRSLMNVRLAAPVDKEFLQIQDEYLQRANEEKGIVYIEDMTEVQPDFYIWKGDITRLGVGAIVNAANSGMTGCYQPCHNCIDNCIHTFAGIELRNFCEDMMQEQGYEEPTGQAKLTPAYNLPCESVIHTVGPIVYGRLTDAWKDDLRNCYRNVLQCCMEHKITSVAFCCISTGEFHFPNDIAAQIAVDTTEQFLAQNENCGIERVIFNVFKDIDLKLYQKYVCTENLYS